MRAQAAATAERGEGRGSRQRPSPTSTGGNICAQRGHTCCLFRTQRQMWVKKWCVYHRLPLCEDSLQVWVAVSISALVTLLKSPLSRWKISTTLHVDDRYISLDCFHRVKTQFLKKEKEKASTATTKKLCVQGKGRKAVKTKASNRGCDIFKAPL